MFGVGFIIGPALGGILGEMGTRVPFYVAAGLSLLNWLYGYFFLPESLAKEKRRKFDFKKANPIGSVLNLRKNEFVFSLTTALFLVYISGFATQATWAFYTIEKFGWTEAKIGLSLGYIGLLSAIVQGGVIRLAIKKFGLNKSLFIGLMMNSIGLLGFALATSDPFMYAVMTFNALAGLASPAFQGIISSKVPEDEQGQLQGGLTSLMSLAAIIGSPLMLGIFRQFTKENAITYFPGMPFLVGSLLSTVSMVLVYRVLRGKKFANKN